LRHHSAQQRVYVADPYASLASQIPSNTCSSYPQIPKKGSYSGHKNCTGTFPKSGSATLGATTVVGGDVQLTGDVTVTSSAGLAGAVLVIENGMLDTNGHKLSTASGSALTIIFSGTSGGGNHYPTDNTSAGTLDFMAPTSGTWKGIALYQDPNLTSNVDFSYAGNNPTWNISGAVYLPNASLGFSGATTSRNTERRAFSSSLAKSLLTVEPRSSRPPPPAASLLVSPCQQIMSAGSPS
jgi:hypothetical protein